MSVQNKHSVSTITNENDTSDRTCLILDQLLLHLADNGAASPSPCWGCRVILLTLPWHAYCIGPVQGHVYVSRQGRSKIVGGQNHRWIFFLFQKHIAKVVTLMFSIKKKWLSFTNVQIKMRAFYVVLGFPRWVIVPLLTWRTRSWLQLLVSESSRPWREQPESRTVQT